MSDHSLLQILNDGEFHTDSQLAESLNLSSSALDELIHNLQEAGLEIEFHNDLGYRLSPGIKLLDKQEVLDGLHGELRDSFHIVDFHLVIDSTNSEALRYVRQGNRGKALFAAEKQESGRGRRGRTWHSPMARNIYLTLVWPFTQKIEELQGLSLVTALSLVNSLKNSNLKGMEKLKVKWPNDVWLDDKKLAGILLELHRDPSDRYQVIIGIGINVNMPSDSLETFEQAATDLVSQGNSTVDRNQILAALIQQLDADIENFMAQGFSGFQEHWHRFDLYHNREVEVRNGDNLSYGTVKGVSSTGALLLHTDEGEVSIVGGELAPSIRSTRS